MTDDFDLDDYANNFAQAEQKYNLPAGLLYRVANQESGGDPTAESDAGAQGLMQLMPATAKSLNVDPFIPSDAIDGSARLLRENLDRYKNVPDALRAYNAGTDKSKWNNKETNNYIASIMDDDSFNPSSNQTVTAQITPVSDKFQMMQDAQESVSPKYKMMQDALGSGESSAMPNKFQMMQDALNSVDTKNLAGTDTAANVISPSSSAPAATAQQTVQQKIDALPFAQRALMKIASDPDSLSPFGLVNALAGGKSLNEQKTPLDTVAADYAKDYANNLINSSSAVKNLATFNNKSNPIQAAVAQKIKDGVPVSNDERAKAFNEAVANNPGGEAASLAMAVPGISAIGSLFNRSVNPLISNVTGLTPAEVNAGETAALPVMLAKNVLGSKDFVNKNIDNVGDISASAAKGAVKISPFATEGQATDKISDMAGGKVTPDLTEYVPGSRPTLGTASANSALATEERSLRADNPNAFPTEANKQARADYLQDIIGSPQDLDSLRSAREEQAIPLKTEAFANKKPTSAQPVIGQIEQILQSPAGKNPAVRSNLNDVRNNLYDNLDPETGKLESDPEQLEGVRQAIASSLTKQAALSGSTARQATRQLSQIMDTLDTTIESGAPGYANYRKTYSEMSGPINEKEYLQDAGFTDSNGNVVPRQITLNKVEKVLNNISDGQKANGINPAKSISPETITKLENIRSDLRRESNIDLGKNRGSTTTTELKRGKKTAVANLLTGAFATAEYSHNPAIAAAAAGTRMLYNYKNTLMQRNILNKFVNPENYVASVQKKNPLQ